MVKTSEKLGFKLPKNEFNLYSPSWFNRFSAWAENKPLPKWLTYALISPLLLLFGVILQASTRSGTIRDFDPIYLVAIFQVSFIFLIIHYLDKQALQAFNDFLPAIKSEDQAKLPELQWRMVNMPSRQSLLVSLVFMTFGLALVIGAIVSGEGFGSAVDVDPGPFGLFTAVIMTLLWFTNGLLAYHTVYQLRLVNRIYTENTVIHPFHQRELFAFSGFAAKTGICLVLITPLWIIFDPGPISLVICIVFALFGLAVFILPLLGVHRILVREKDRLLDENGRLVEQTIRFLTADMQSGASSQLSSHEQSLSSLESARKQIERISTWPWKAETMRQLLTAIILPTFIWLIQYLLSKYLLQ